MAEEEGEGVALSLPGEVWAEIAGFLSTRDLLRLASANSRLRALALRELRRHRATHHSLHTTRGQMNAILAFLRNHCPRLSHLDLSEWENADDRLLRDAFSSSSSRATPAGGEKNEEDDGEDGRGEVCMGFEMLEELNLGSTSVTDRGMAFVPESLTSLDLSGLGEALTDSGLKRVTQRCTRLVALNVAQTSVTNSGLQCLSDQVEHLDISCTNVSNHVHKQEARHIYSRKLVAVPLPRNLRVLSLIDLDGRAALTRLLMTSLCSCQHLRTLRFGTQSQMNLPCTHGWMKMTALRELTLSRVHVYEKTTLWFLPDGLRSLTLSNISSSTTPDHVRCLPSSLTSLDFSPTYFYSSRPWLLPLKRTLPELKRLRISGFRNLREERSKLIEMGVDLGPDDSLAWRDGVLPDETEEELAWCPRERNERWRAELEHPSVRRLEDKPQPTVWSAEEELEEEALIPVEGIDLPPDGLEEEDEEEDDEEGPLLAVGW